MRDFLAEKLLVKIMEWTPEQISTERPLLQALANFKYDNYQQFSPGIRFIESLVRWLSQFAELTERLVAYNFIKTQLIFISNEQMSYLVNIAFNSKINPIIISRTADELKLKEHFVRKIINSNEYQSNLRKSLFIGLSDGSRIDYLRRSSNINNEQVTTTHEISHEKIQDMLKELETSQGGKYKFQTAFLVDDFTASGISYFRPEEKKGKVWRFLDKVFSDDQDWHTLVDIDNLDIHVLFYLATKTAIETIQGKIDDWKKTKGITNCIKVYAIQIIDNIVKERVEANIDLINLAKKYFDGRIMDRHFKKGKHDNPYLGFSECGLPLIINHNTPNNSLPILWFPDDMEFKGLFPRVTRHKK
jgi:hypothetical protein